jgi:hypothetical protein
MSAPLKQAILALPNDHWKSADVGAGRVRQWAEVNYLPDDGVYKKDHVTPRRNLAIRVRLAQGDLLGSEEGVRHFCIVTNRSDPKGGSGLDIISWHRGKAGTIEHPPGESDRDREVVLGKLGTARPYDPNDASLARPAARASRRGSLTRSWTFSARSKPGWRRSKRAATIRPSPAPVGRLPTGVRTERPRRPERAFDRLAALTASDLQGRPALLPPDGPLRRRLALRRPLGRGLAVRRTKPR